MEDGGADVVIVWISHWQQLPVPASPGVALGDVPLRTQENTKVEHWCEVEAPLRVAGQQAHGLVGPGAPLLPVLRGGGQGGAEEVAPALLRPPVACRASEEAAARASVRGAPQGDAPPADRAQDVATGSRVLEQDMSTGISGLDLLRHVRRSHCPLPHRQAQLGHEPEVARWRCQGILQGRQQREEQRPRRHLEGRLHGIGTSAVRAVPVVRRHSARH
mmetsp:Transcript_32733/g.97423  ORF Transcript_32733/g.97423 Transcript_32733/m.97423 type:complete len:218 (-) Transcript_32733:453-1106(-)